MFVCQEMSLAESLCDCSFRKKNLGLFVLASCLSSQELQPEAGATTAMQDITLRHKIPEQMCPSVCAYSRCRQEPQKHPGRPAHQSSFL